ncbi:hypothetical protein O3M35_012570 [Rhynocoris fuscipes]|uniref:Drebrin-like protein n=1 Tax=Rhynocoris fuscipes TaxID=488301 RepID=A0AAW1CZA4_9HEMI
MSVNLEKNREAILAAWKDVVDDKTATDWALFGYEGQTNTLQFVSKGDGGLEELKDELNSGKIMYAFARVRDPKTSLPKCILINWQGEGAPMVRKGTCANHIRDVSNLLKGVHVTINARNDEEVDPDIIIEKVAKSTGSAYTFGQRIDIDRQTTPVGTTYQRTIPKNEINIAERDKFWQKEEEEEKRRIAEERRIKEEKRIQAEKERQQREQMLSERESPDRVVKKNDSNRQEAEQLIKMRNFDPRAMFEKNTCAGQMSSRSSSKDSNSISPNDTNNSKINTVWPPQANDATEAEIPIEKNNVEEPIEQQPVLEEAQTVTAQPYNAQGVEYIEDNFLNGNEILEYDDLGLRAEALYDYQAADETEISFDPGDIITHIDQIDAGWWQGLGPDGTFGLFPANYVQLLE